MNKEELLKAIMELPKTETDDLISAMNSINVNDLMSAVDRLNKVPDYNDLLKENKKQKEVIYKAREIIQKMFETGFYNDDYYLGHLNQIFQDKEVE